MRKQRTVPAELSGVFETIRRAIAEREQVVLTYDGEEREVCPHSLGWKGERLSCLAFQFAGGSRSYLPATGQWRCMHLDLMMNVRAQRGPWHTGPAIHLNSSCIDYFAASVESAGSTPGREA